MNAIAEFFEKTGMAQADLPGKANQQVQPEHVNGVDRHADDQIEVKAVGQQPGQDGQPGNQQRQTQRGTERLNTCLHGYTRSVVRAPNRP